MSHAPDTSTESALLVPFSTLEAPVPNRVGGKAASLIRLQQAGFNVPHGVVLTTQFFESWIAEIQTTVEWSKATGVLHECGPRKPNLQQRTELAEACDRVKALARALPLTGDQQALIGAIEPEIGGGPYAVRSSSPEEDLTGASFAGLYETVLGVDSESLTDAVRTCFCSCLDPRVLLYKHEMEFESLAPAIAVVVQCQVASDISGVAFSLNPLTNDFDELLINASWGLGEALVTGDITPDTVVVDKVTGEVISHRAGDKGGDRPEEKCLAGDQIAEIADTLKRIEALYDDPVDVEWSVSNNTLHVLQARPITAYVPLPESLQTAPGEPRHLYMDAYLTDAMTMSDAVTPMSDDVCNLLYQLFFQWMVNIPAREMDLAGMGMLHPGSSRSYIDVSMYMHFMGIMGEGKAMANLFDGFNPIISGMLTSPDIERYRPAKVPAQMRTGRLLWYLPGILWRTRRAWTVLLGPLFFRNRFDAKYARVLKEFDEWVTRPMDYSQSVDDCLIEGCTQMGSTIMVSVYPALSYYLYMTSRIKGLVDSDSPEQLAWVDEIGWGFENDMIVNMGVMIYDMSVLLPASEFDDIDALATKLEQRDMPEKFLALWDEFVRRYGCRGPLEMELANPKYGEAPQLALRQMAAIAASGGEFDPHESARKQAERRERAYNNLLENLPPRKAKRLAKYYTACSGYYAEARDMIKHQLMQVYERARKLLLHRADEFIRAGRLDRQDQIFELIAADVDRAAQDPGFDLRAAVEERGAFYRKQKSHVRHFPLAIDSRGRILRPAVKYEEGALVGAAVGPGVARGPVKVLNDPFEKEVQPGDVLVAVTTDPGWTPLFINAAAVILEIGGELQHGALVAREYGKPCVSSIPDVTSHFEDGQVVEVDGDAGVVRFVD